LCNAGADEQIACDREKTREKTGRCDNSKKNLSQRNLDRMMKALAT
jgi:hypothetical protein